MAYRTIRIDYRRHAAWSVLTLLFAGLLAGLLALPMQGARRGWSVPVAEPTSATSVVAAFPLPIPTPNEVVAPGYGTTGTIALPAPPPAASIPGPRDLGIVAARPFAFGHAGRLDRLRALECLTAAIYYEAASEPDAGQAAVAQVVLNRVRHPAFPASVCGVVYQGSDHAGCQFSFACDGSLVRHQPSAGGWARAARTAAAALAGQVYAPVGLATHYHSFAVTPAWNRGLVMTAAVGAHFFHRWKGWWGTAAAFRQIYAGGEPVPRPLAPPAAPPSSFAEPVLALATPVSLGPMSPRPVPLAPPANGDHLPAASTVLPRWRNSGAPLR